MSDLDITVCCMTVNASIFIEVDKSASVVNTNQIDNLRRIVLMPVSDQELEEMAERHIKLGMSWIDRVLTAEEMNRLYEIIRKKEKAT